MKHLQIERDKIIHLQIERETSGPYSLLQVTLCEVLHAVPEQLALDALPQLVPEGSLECLPNSSDVDEGEVLLDLLRQVREDVLLVLVGQEERANAGAVGC